MIESHEHFDADHHLCRDRLQNIAALDAAFSTRVGEIRPLPVRRLDRARSRSSTPIVTAAFTPSLLPLHSGPALRSREACRMRARRRRTSRPRWKRCCRDRYRLNRPRRVGLVRARWLLLRRAKRCDDGAERQPGRRMKRTRRVAKLRRTRWIWTIDGHVCTLLSAHDTVLQAALPILGCIG